jgi:hypothetical protein
MKKIFALVLPLTVALSASFGCASASAAQHAHKAPVAEAAFQTAPQAVQTTHSLQRRDVYNQLVKAEEDGSLASLNATVYFGG